MRFITWLKKAFVSLVNDDTSAYPTMQAQYSGKPSTVVRLSPYGLESNPPKGAFCLLLSPNGQAAGKFAISADFLKRYKGLREGEAVLYNTLTQSYTIMREDGSIESKSSVKIRMEAPIIEIVGDIVHTGSQSTSESITAADTVTGATEVIFGTTTCSGHVHSGVQTGGDDTGTPV